MGKFRICTATIFIALMSGISAQSGGLLEGVSTLKFDFVTPGIEDIRDPFATGEIEELYSDVPPKSEFSPNIDCLGPPPLTRVIGGCNHSRMICVCGESCNWLQICRNE